MRIVWKKLRGSRPFQVALGRTLAAYLRLVWNTSSLTLEPENIYNTVDREIPFILTFWHGQHFLMPFVMKPHHEGKVMISRHADADINAITAEAFGVGTIRGSGSHGRDFLRKGGISATKIAIGHAEVGDQRRDDGRRAEDFAGGRPWGGHGRPLFPATDISDRDRDKEQNRGE